MNKPVGNNGHASRFINREISWLSFNHRVLQEAADPDVPIMNRLKFLAIFSSNLDEFFRVRVASLRSLLRLKDKHTAKLDFNPARLLKDIQHVVVRQQRAFGDVFSHSILPALRKEGIHLDLDGSLTDEQQRFVRHYFRDELHQLVDPVILRQDADLPFLKNKGLYLVTELWPTEKSSPVFVEEPFYGLLEIPADAPRFVKVPSADGLQHVLFSDDIIRHNLATLFPAYEIGESYSIKVTRDAELYIEDEFAGNLVELIRKSLKKRERGVPTRFLYDMRMPYPMVTAMKDLFELDDEDLVVGGRYHNFSDFFGFPDFDRGELMYQELEPARHPLLSTDEPVSELIAESDALIHPPYHAFDHVIRFLEEAAGDPETSEVYATLYRTARHSKVIQALADAARNGKQVTAFVEVKARFDEAPNLESARQMEEAGVNVLYSMPGIKVHAKLLLVRRANGEMTSYLGTGNFNENTSRVYADTGLFTSDPDISQDVLSIFRYLQDQSVEPEFSHLAVAPFTMRERFEQLVDNEIAAAKSGMKAAITVKMNSLEDDDMIERLYRAEKAGVRVQIICRGICCLKAGVNGLSDDIRVISIVDRFLEHARAYVFENDGDRLVYLASADWMKRNLTRRVEVAFPILDPNLNQEILDILDLQLRDCTKARIIDSKMKNRFVDPRNGADARAQVDTYLYLLEKGEHSGNVRLDELTNTESRIEN